MKAKILVADESPTIHKIVAMAFEKEGMIVEGISRGEHVLEYMVEYQPDIILADIHLPGLDGYQLSREIKSSTQFPATRVVLLTSDFEDVDEEQLKQSQADDTISKPFKSEEIRKKVKSQLQVGDPEPEAPALETHFPSEPEAPAPTPEASEAPEELDAPTAASEVIQQEYEDIVSQQKEVSPPPVAPVFAEEEEEPVVADPVETKVELPLEDVHEPAAVAIEPLAEPVEQPQAAPKVPAPQVVDAEVEEMMIEVSEEAMEADSRPAIQQGDDFTAVFESVLAAPPTQEAELPPREPGSKPNLIEETMMMMAHRHFEDDAAPKEPVLEETPEPVAEPVVEPVTDAELIIEPIPQDARNTPDLALGRRLVDDHMNQVIERLPQNPAQGEASGALENTVRQVLGEVGPEIIRKVIQEEIENIKKMEEA